LIILIGLFLIGVKVLKKFGKCFTSFLFLFLALASSTDAFVLLRGNSYLKGERPVSRAIEWTGRTLNFYINSDLDVYAGTVSHSITSDDLVTAVKSAISEWNDLCNSDFTINYVGTTSLVKDANDDVNVISFDDRTTVEGNPLNASGALAAAFSVESNDVFSDCDILVNGNYTFSILGNTSSYDLIGILVHEIGHCLGLDHSVEAGSWTSSDDVLNDATMRSAVPLGTTDLRTPNRDDQDGLSCVYERYLGLRAGNYCGSYLGTSGGGALSGVLSAKNSSDNDITCNYRAEVNIQPRGGVEGVGCISNAIADETSKYPNSVSNRTVAFDLIFLFLLLPGYVFWQRCRRSS